MKKSIAFFMMTAALCVAAQQPQTQLAPIYPVNAKYVNGVAPGYAPTAGSGLTLNVSAGTANCGGTIVTYAGGTLTMTASTTNYVYLNTASSCAPAVKTTSFTSSDIPIASIGTTGSAISAINDYRLAPSKPGAAGTVVTSINGATGAFTLTGSAFAGCSTSGGVTTCTFTGGASVAGTFSIDSYGGVGDGNLAANTGTDNTSAYSAAYAAAAANGGGTIILDCGKTYRFSGAGPTITTGYIGIASSAPYCWSFVFTSSASATIIGINGADELHKINNPSLQWVFAGRAVAPSSGAIGIQVTNTNQALIGPTTAQDSPTCYDIYDDPSNGWGSFQKNTCLWGFGNFSWSATTGIGFNLRGGTGTNAFYGFQTLVGSYNTVNINPSNATITTSYGHKVSGNIVDLNWDFPATATGINYALYMVGATNPDAQDVHVTNLAADRCLTECAYINVPSANGIEISGGNASWMTLVDTAQTAGIEINDTPNVIVKDFLSVVSQDIPVVKIDNGSTNAHVSNIQCTLGYGSVSKGQCVSISGSNIIGLSDINVTGSGRSGFALAALQYVNSSNGTLSGIKMAQGTGTPISFDASSNNNQYWNLNNSLAGWGTVSDGGAGNQYTLPQGSSSQPGILQCGTGTTCSAGVISVAGSAGFQYSYLNPSPSLSSFTAHNIQTGTTLTQGVGGALDLSIPGTSSLNWQFYTLSTPSTPWSVQAYLKDIYPGTGNSSNYGDFGFYLYDGTKLEGIEHLTGTGTGSCTSVPGCFRIEHITNDTTDNSTVFGPSIVFSAVPMVGLYERWCDSGSTLYAEWSLDGSTWVQLYSESVGSFITPISVGFGGASQGATVNEIGSLQGWSVTSGATCP